MVPRLGVVILIAGVIAAGCGPGDEPNDTTSPTAATAITLAPSATTGSSDGPNAAPRWETVSTFTGTGPGRTQEFEILADAIQWRVRWTCESGHLRITAVPPPRRPGPMVDADCPSGPDGFSIQEGRSHLEVDASGPWKAIVDQQLEAPLDEPPPPGLDTARLVAHGTFQWVEKAGKGSARIHELADGRRILRFEDFEVSLNTDLFVWLSEAPNPRTTVEAQGAPKVSIGNLKSTVGNQNYEVPPELPTERIRSVVIWCEPVSVAYISAPLGR